MILPPTRFANFLANPSVRSQVLEAQKPLMERLAALLSKRFLDHNLTPPDAKPLIGPGAVSSSNRCAVPDVKPVESGGNFTSGTAESALEPSTPPDPAMV